MDADKSSPIRPVDDAARSTAKSIISSARFGALGVIDAESGGPMVSRVAIGTAPDETVISLVSELSNHTKALRQNPAASLLLGEPGPKGDPLTHPRLTLMVRARFVEHTDPEFAALSTHYLKTHPKSKLYIDFGDFSFLTFEINKAFLNAGFGKAYQFDPDEF